MFNQKRNAALCFSALVLLTVGMLTGCSARSSSDHVDRIRQSLHTAGLTDVTVTADANNGVVTLGGHVPSDGAKAQADSVARSMAGNQVVANQIAVIPPGFENRANQVYSDLDKGINDNLDAALLQEDLHKGVTYSVKNGVVTLTGEVPSQELRGQIQMIASKVPNVQQVVNELQVKNQKASSSN